jgi:sulfofructose kinase
MSFEVVGIGDLCLDFTASTTRVPETDMMSPLLFTTIQGGGKVPTALVALSRLGVQTALFSTIGTDKAGMFCKSELDENGVNTEYLVSVNDCPTNLSICLAEKETGGRSFIGRYNMRTIRPEELDRACISKARFLHLWSASPAAVVAAEWIHAAGGTVSYDADRYDPETEKNIGMTDVFICSEFFFCGMCGKKIEEANLENVLKDISARGPKIVIVTMGSRGYAGIDQLGFFRGQAFSNVDVVDTTGAGDTFHGAFFYGLLHGWDARKTARFAAAVSAVKCTAPGGRAGIPDYDTVEKFLKTGEIDDKTRKHWMQYYENNRIL